MCRIAGIIHNSLSVAAIEPMVEEMCRLLKAGGPDDEGFYTDARYQLVLGHRRLSIIDLSQAGHQPMCYDNQRYWITYNGELYNYPELKTALIATGCQFKSHSDTEVILAAFATWGTAAFKKFNGMFAFALWDSAAGSIYLVRDSSGIKPLYFAITSEGLAFASEVKAFVPVPWLQEAHPHWPVYLMAYGHLPEPITTLKEVKPLPKGSWLQYDTATGSVKTDQFSRFSYLEKINDRQEAIQKVREGLQKAVKSHLLADAPIGVFLSGGLDSSILALLANNENTRLNTISLYFEQDHYSEKEHQDRIQQQLNCNHYQHLLKEEEFHQFFPSIIRSMDLPGCDGINTWFISRYAKESGLKAVLSGVGADELFGGYPSFERIKAALLFERLPKALLRAGNISALKRFRRLSYLSIGGAAGRYLFLRGQFTPNEIAANLGTSEEQVWQILSGQPQYPDIDHLTAPNQASWMETNMYMQNQLLRDADTMSMANGVEIRVPYLEADFMRLLLQVDSPTKYGGVLGKQLLVDSFKDILPESIYNRPKMGFSFPFKEWLGRNEFARDTMLNDKNGNAKKFLSGRMHWSQYLTSMLITNLNHA